MSGGTQPARRVVDGMESVYRSAATSIGSGGGSSPGSRRRRDHRFDAQRPPRPHRRGGPGVRPLGVHRQAHGTTSRPLQQVRVAAAKLARDDAGVDRAPTPSARAPSSAAESAACKRCTSRSRSCLTPGPERTNPLLIPMMIPNMGAAQVSLELGTKGPLSSTCTACAAGSDAIASAYHMIRRGDAEVMFAGGSEAPISAVGVAGFAAARSLSRRNDDPAGASRPFDAGRDGFVIGEGAGCLVLEELEHAPARRAHPRRTRRRRSQLRFVPHDRAGQTGESQARAVRRPSTWPGSSLGHRLRQRPRHGDARRRHRRDEGDQGRARRARRARSPCPPTSP